MEKLIDIDKKLSPDQLFNLYQTNREYFEKIAKHYQDNDKEFYEEYIKPLIVTLKPGEVYCPFCHKKTIPVKYITLSKNGNLLRFLGIMFGIGGLLIMATVFVPCGLFALVLCALLLLSTLFHKKEFLICEHCRLKIER